MTDEPQPPADKGPDAEGDYGVQEPWTNPDRDPDIPAGYMLGPDGLVVVERRANGEDAGLRVDRGVLDGCVWSGAMLRDYEPVPRQWIVEHRIPQWSHTLYFIKDCVQFTDKGLLRGDLFTPSGGRIAAHTLHQARKLALLVS